MSATVAIELSGGQDAEAVSFDGSVLVMLSPCAFAPGAPLQLTARLPERNVELQGKTVGSKRHDAQRFELRLRLVNLRRTDREALRAAIGG